VNLLLFPRNVNYKKKIGSPPTAEENFVYLQRVVIKLVWPFTSNTGRENGKKGIQVEIDVNTTTRKNKEQMGR
jgi:hypothetical protein